MKKGWTISKKTMAGIIIYALVLSSLMGFAGALIFNHAIAKEYNDRGYVLANIILNEIDHDKIAEYATTWKKDDYYVEMSSYLRDIQDVSDAAYIYIMVPYEDKTMRYIYDRETFIGDTDPISASFDEVWAAYTQGVKPTSYLVRKSQKYGFLTSSCLPVKDSTDEVVALLFVDTRMEVILSTIYKYAGNMALISLVLLAIYCLVCFKMLNKNFLNPIMIMRDNVKGFAENNARADDTLLTIKTGDEVEDLAVDIDSMEKDIVKYIDNIQTITAEKERIGAELSVATKIQADMLPRIFPAFPGRTDFDVFATMHPAKEVGGDFYDFFLIDDDHLALVMADVSGKGVPAALFMVIAKTLIKNRTQYGRNISRDVSPAQALHDVNNRLCEGNDAEMFVTVWLAIIELSTGKGIAANAGHEHPVIKRAGGKYELVVYKHSPAIATITDLKFTEHEFKLNPGDSIFVHTDGVTEATNLDNKLFGTDRLLDALNKEPDAEAEKLLGNVSKAIDDFVGEAPQFDDITMLSFKYLGNG